MASESHQPVCGKQALNGEGNPIHFYPRDAMLARILAMALCLSVCLLQVGVLLKRLNKSRFFDMGAFFHPFYAPNVRVLPYEEFFSWGNRHHCPMEVGAYAKQRYSRTERRIPTSLNAPLWADGIIK